MRRPRSSTDCWFSISMPVCSMKKGLSEAAHDRISNGRFALGRPGCSAPHARRWAISESCAICSAAIGAPPKLHRPPMPRPTGYYPFPFDLLPFGDDALYKFLVFELPRGFPLPPPPGADPDAQVPVPMIFGCGGARAPHLRVRRRALRQDRRRLPGRSPEAELFIGPTIGPDRATTGPTRCWTSRSSTIAPRRSPRIENIIEDGEGTPDEHAIAPTTMAF